MKAKPATPAELPKTLDVKCPRGHVNEWPVTFPKPDRFTCTTCGVVFGPGVREAPHERDTGNE